MSTVNPVALSPCCFTSSTVSCSILLWAPGAYFVSYYDLLGPFYCRLLKYFYDPLQCNVLQYVACYDFFDLQNSHYVVVCCCGLRFRPNITLCCEIFQLHSSILISKWSSTKASPHSPLSWCPKWPRERLASQIWGKRLLVIESLNLYTDLITTKGKMITNLRHIRRPMPDPPPVIKTICPATSWSSQIFRSTTNIIIMKRRGDAVLFRPKLFWCCEVKEESILKFS